VLDWACRVRPNLRPKRCNLTLGRAGIEFYSHGHNRADETVRRLYENLNPDLDCMIDGRRNPGQPD
jgi:hypothetical protein